MELWAMRLDRTLTEGEDRALTARLPPDRRMRLAGVHSPEKRREVLCAYALLGLALRESYGWDALPEMAWTDAGKPWFPSLPNLHFSLSHTAGAVLAGVSETPIGVDIERLRPVPRRLAARLGFDAPEAFFREWTRREASVKRSGAGLPALAADLGQSLVQEGLWSIDILPGYAASACGEPDDLPEPVRLRAITDLLRNRGLPDRRFS